MRSAAPHVRLPPDEPAPARRALPRWLLPAGLALVLTGLVGGLALGRSTADPGVGRVADTASLGFLRDMTVHHAQAVQMSEVLHRRTTDPALSYLAFDVLSTQQGQIGIMTGWLDLWDQPQGDSAPTMAWMGHTGPMPGMATQQEVDRLEPLPVAQLEEQWLRLMVRHHRGAVPMAEEGARRAESPDVARLAQQMAVGQQSEIDAMQDLLRRRGVPPEPAGAGEDASHDAGHDAVHDAGHEAGQDAGHDAGHG